MAGLDAHPGASSGRRISSSSWAWRWSRTCSEPTSTRWTRRGPSAASSTSSGSRRNRWPAASAARGRPSPTHCGSSTRRRRSSRPSMDGRISEGHARALAGLDEPPAGRIARTSSSPASSRSATRSGSHARFATPRPAPAAPATPSGSDADPDLEQMEKLLRDALATKVTAAARRVGVDESTITYFDADDLARLVDRLAGGAR